MSCSRRDCGAVGFEPNNESGAFDIVAAGVGCMIAREIAARAEGVLGDSYRTPGGFTSEPRRADSESSPTVEYTCTRDRATIRFNTS